MTGTSISWQALLKAGGIGLGVVVLITLINAGIALVIQPATFSADPNNAGLVMALGGVALCLCCGILLAYGGVGALYGVFSNQSGSSIEVGQMALGGALGGIATGFLGSLCSGLTNLITGVSQAAQLGTVGGFDPAAAAAGTALGTVGGFLIYFCITLIISPILGAAGGAIYAATQGNKAPAAPPPAM